MAKHLLQQEEHGLYINSLIYGIDYIDTVIDAKYRSELEKRAEEEGLEVLYSEACKIDEMAVKNISKNDRKRIIRVLEIYKQTGKTKTELDIESRKGGVEFDYKMFVINMQREILYNRINKRVDLMIEKGLIEEVQGILDKYKTISTSFQAIGYKETREYLEGHITKDEMIEKVKMETRRYAKRQLTWFRKNEGAIWLDGLKSKKENMKIILETI